MSFADDVARDKFLKSLKEASTALAGTAGESVLNALGTIRLDPPLKADHERTVALFVTGRKMEEGTLAQMRQRFQQECDSHSGSVELRELREGEWVSISSRRRQRA